MDYEVLRTKKSYRDAVVMIDVTFHYAPRSEKGKTWVGN